MTAPDPTAQARALILPALIAADYCDETSVALERIIESVAQALDAARQQGREEGMNERGPLVGAFDVVRVTVRKAWEHERENFMRHARENAQTIIDLTRDKAQAEQERDEALAAVSADTANVVLAYAAARTQLRQAEAALKERTKKPCYRCGHPPTVEDMAAAPQSICIKCFRQLERAEQERDALRETLVRVMHGHANRAHFHVEGHVAVVTHLNCDGDPALTEAFTILGWPNPVKVEDAR